MRIRPALRSEAARPGADPTTLAGKIAVERMGNEEAGTSRESMGVGPAKCPHATGRS